jgi:hypothetical protein
MEDLSVSVTLRDALPLSYRSKFMNWTEFTSEGLILTLYPPFLPSSRSTVNFVERKSIGFEFDIMPEPE